MTFTQKYNENGALEVGQYYDLGLIHVRLLPLWDYDVFLYSLSFRCQISQVLAIF